MWHTLLRGQLLLPSSHQHLLNLLDFCFLYLQYSLKCPKYVIKYHSQDSVSKKKKDSAHWRFCVCVCVFHIFSKPIRDNSMVWIWMCVLKFLQLVIAKDVIKYNRHTEKKMGTFRTVISYNQSRMIIIDHI